LRGGARLDLLASGVGSLQPVVDECFSLFVFLFFIFYFLFLINFYTKESTQKYIGVENRKTLEYAETEGRGVGRGHGPQKNNY
jgi:hypothetical protein